VPIRSFGSQAIEANSSSIVCFRVALVSEVRGTMLVLSAALIINVTLTI
jgi:hypothetical protein